MQVLDTGGGRCSPDPKTEVGWEEVHLSEILVIPEGPLSAINHLSCCDELPLPFRWTTCHLPGLPSLAHTLGFSASSASSGRAVQPNCSEHQLQNQAACAQILAQTLTKLQGSWAGYLASLPRAPHLGNYSQF